VHFFKITHWILLGILLGLWGFGCSQQTLETACSGLQKVVKGEAVCVDSDKVSEIAGKKINLKERLTEQNVDAISLSRFQSSELIMELDLSDNPHLTSLPEFVLDLPNLVYLDISNTKISDWGEEICQLKKLETLVGTHNNYKNGEIPFHTFCIENLKILDMSHGNIKYLDEYVGRLQRLKELRLRNNQLFIVPLMIQQIPEISVVDFRNNFFKDDKINTLHNCHLVSSEEKEDCREEMLETISCIFYYELPSLRGEPLRKIYTDLSGQNLDEFESVDAKIPINKDRCYTAWVVWMIDYEESPELLEKTIRGKTLRELRYMSPYQSEHVPFTCYSTDWPFITDDYEPKNMAALPWEIAPEEFREHGFATNMSSCWRDSDYWIPVEECPHLVDLADHVKRKQRIPVECPIPFL